jgi:hypothetical protein
MHQVLLRRNDIPRITQILYYKIYESVKKYNCILMRAEVFLAGLKAQGGEGGGRILLDDNMESGRVTLWPIRFQGFGVWISTGLFIYIYIYIYSHVALRAYVICKMATATGCLPICS